MRRSIRWTSWSEDHIARHGVTPSEVEQVVCTRPRLVARGREECVLVFGATETGRHLVVVLSPDPDGDTAFVVTARQMTVRERAAYRRRAR